jgi:hypothetical protein
MLPNVPEISTLHSNQVTGDRARPEVLPHLVLVDLSLDIVQVAVGEDDADVADQLVQDDSPLVVAGGLAVQADGALHHGVLAHEDDSARAQTLQGTALSG